MEVTTHKFLLQFMEDRCKKNIYLNKLSTNLGSCCGENG